MRKNTYYEDAYAVSAGLEQLQLMPPVLNSLILEYLWQDEVADIIEAVTRFLPRRMQFPELVEIYTLLEGYLRVMNKYKETPFADKVSAEKQLRAFFSDLLTFWKHGGDVFRDEDGKPDCDFFIYSHSYLGQMVECLIGNSRLLEAKSDAEIPRSTHNLITEIRRYHPSITDPLGAVLSECRQIICHSLSFVGLVTIVMSGEFLELILKTKRKVTDKHSANSFILTFAKIAKKTFDSLDQKMGRIFQTNYGLNKSCFMGLWGERYDFMFAVTPKEFELLKNYYDSVCIEGEKLEQLKNNIAKSLNEYSYYQNKKEPLATAEADNLSRLVEECKTFKALKILIKNAFTLTNSPLKSMSFEPTAIGIKDLIRAELRASRYHFKPLKVALPKDTLGESNGMRK